MKINDYKVDLHIHTNASDGTWSVEELLFELRKKDIKVFAVTDHDTIENALKIKKLELEDQQFIMGVEISTTYQKKEYHITAYDFDYSNVKLLKLLEDNRNKRKMSDIKLIEYVKQSGLLENIEDYHTYEYNRCRGGWKSLNYLKDKMLVNDLKDFFEIANRSQEVVMFEHPLKVIEIIKKAGGNCFLAHPSGYNKGNKFPLAELDRWNEFGIDGIECYSPYLSELTDAKYYIDYCNKNNMLISAGSDCHGTFIDRELGYPKVKYSDIRLK